MSSAGVKDAEVLGNLLLQLMGNREGLLIECTFNLGAQTTRWRLKDVDSEELIQRHRTRWRRCRGVDLVDTSHQSGCMPVERSSLVSTPHKNDTISGHVSTSGVGGGDSKIGTRSHPGRRKLRCPSGRMYRRCRDLWRLSLKRLSLVGGCLLCLTAIAPLPLAARKVGLALLVDASS